MRDRTADLLRARQALSQLSYGPLSNASPPRRSKVVGLRGIEPPTSPLSGVRSNQLSYRPNNILRKSKPGFQETSDQATTRHLAAPNRPVTRCKSSQQQALREALRVTHTLERTIFSLQSAHAIFNQKHPEKPSCL